MAGSRTLFCRRLSTLCFRFHYRHSQHSKRRRRKQSLITTMAPSAVLVPSLRDLTLMQPGPERDSSRAFLKVILELEGVLRRLNRWMSFGGRRSLLSRWVNRRWHVLFRLPGEHWSPEEPLDAKLVQLNCTALEVYQEGYFSAQQELFPQLFAAVQLLDLRSASTFKYSWRLLMLT